VAQLMRAATRALVCGVVLVALASGGRWAAAHSRDHDRPRRPHGLGLAAAYEWHDAGQLGRREARERLRFLRRHGFETVYLDLGDHLDVADQPPSPQRRARLRELRRHLRHYVADASRLGLSVHAVGGGPTWTEASRRYLGSKLVELVAAYNDRADPWERLDGVQLDIEPYALPAAFFADTRRSLLAYLETLRSIVATWRREARRLELGFAVPFWFDGRAGSPGPVPFQGATKPAIHHVIDLLGDFHRAYLVVMSYRNLAHGADGSIANARDEFAYARSVGADCGLLVAQQFGPAEPPEITFHGLDRGAFRQAAEQLVEAFGRSPRFRGLAVNDLDGYLAVWRRGGAA
jgi:hypothetical protein